MTHGQPDFGMYAPKETVYSAADMAELAVRLGSIVSYDRRGDVVWMDDFETPRLRWDKTLNGVGSAIALSYERAKSGNQSVKLDAGTTDSGYVHIDNAFAILNPSRLGFEITFSLNNADIIFQQSVRPYVSGYRYYPYIRYDMSTEKLQLLGDDNLWKDIFTIDLNKTSHNEHTIKSVIDLNNETYVRLLIDDYEIDVSSYGLYKLTTTQPTGIYVEYWVTGITATSYNSVFADDFIITQNEP